MEPLEELLAREAIRDVVVRYAMSYDDHDWEQWETLWTDDVVFTVDGVPIEGLAALKAFIMSCLPEDYVSKHFLGPSLIELAPDGLSANVKTDVVWIAANHNNQIVARYVDRFVNRAGRWLIARRDEVPVPYRPGPPPMSDEAISLSSPTMRRDEDDA
jgi:uncharacterized protein (TIGR02246 family)